MLILHNFISIEIIRVETHSALSHPSPYTYCDYCVSYIAHAWTYLRCTKTSLTETDLCMSTRLRGNREIYCTRKLTIFVEYCSDKRENWTTQTISDIFYPRNINSPPCIGGCTPVTWSSYWGVAIRLDQYLPTR